MTVRKRSTIASPVNLLISLIIFSFFTLFTYSLWKRPSVNAGGLFPCLRAFFQGGRCPPWIRFRFRRNRKRYPPLVRTVDEAAPPRRGQWSKSPAELDFYGEFYSALCGAPVLPVLPKTKCGRSLRPKGAKKARRRRAFQSVDKVRLHDVNAAARQRAFKGVCCANASKPGACTSVWIL